MTDLEKLKADLDAARAAERDAAAAYGSVGAAYTAAAYGSVGAAYTAAYNVYIAAYDAYTAACEG